MKRLISILLVFALLNLFGPTAQVVTPSAKGQTVSVGGLILVVVCVIVIIYGANKGCKATKRWYYRVTDSNKFKSTTYSNLLNDLPQLDSTIKYLAFTDVNAYFEWDPGLDNTTGSAAVADEPMPRAAAPWAAVGATLVDGIPKLQCTSTRQYPTRALETTLESLGCPVNVIGCPLDLQWSYGTAPVEDPNPATVVLQGSTDLSNWYDLTSMVVGSNGCPAYLPPEHKTEFYRVRPVTP